MSVKLLSDPWAAFAEQFGKDLRARRQAAGLTQEDLAYRAGMTRNYYRNLEKGRDPQGKPTNPSLKMMVGLAVALNADAADLVPSGWRDLVRDVF